VSTGRKCEVLLSPTNKHCAHVSRRETLWSVELHREGLLLSMTRRYGVAPLRLWFDSGVRLMSGG